MAGLTTAAKNSMLAALTGQIGAFGLHGGDPGAAGTANELSGGSPAYGRKATAFPAPANGTVSASTLPTFDVPAGSTVAYISYWTAVAGTFLGSRPLSATETYTGQGTYTPSAVTESLA